MSTRHLKVLLGIFAALVAAWGVAHVVTGRGRAPSQPLALASESSTKLDSVMIAAKTDTVRLRGTASGWTVNGKEAMAEAGESLQKALQDARIGELVSRNPDNFDRLGVADGEGRQATFFAGGKPETELIVGGSAGGPDGAYVRRPGEKAVYLLHGTLPNLVRRGVEDWRNKDIVSAARNDVHRIEFRYPADTFALARDSAAWRLEPGDVKAKPGEVTRVVGQLTSLRALGFAADSVVDTLSWADAAGTVRLLGPDGASLGELTFLKRADNGYYVRRSDKPTVYTVSKYTGEGVLKSRSELAVADSVTGKS